jgi:predicted CxxxxCH...CXXCH cytochrome family protein
MTDENGSSRPTQRAFGWLGRLSRVALAALLMAPAGALAATVTRFPASNVVSGLTGGWGTPTNAYADDTAYASVLNSVAKRGEYANDFGTFGFNSAIPVGATINSVTIGVAWYVTPALASPTTLGVQPYISGVASGTEFQNVAQPTAITVQSSPAYTLTRADLLDGTFAVRARLLRANVANSQSGYLDYVSVTVDYTAPVAPGAPGIPSYGTVGANTLTVNWTASVTGTPAPTYTLQQATSSSGPFTNVSNAACVGTSALTCDVSGLSANTAYWFQVVASNGVAPDATSASSSKRTLPNAITAAPTFGTVTTASILVTWSIPTGGAATYELDRSTASDFSVGLVTTTGIVGNSSTANTLSAGTTYYFRVRPVNADGGVQPTSSPTGTRPTLPPQATAPTVAVVAATTNLGVSWSPVTGATSYDVERSTTSGSGFALVQNVATTSWTDTTTAGNRTYYYRILGRNVSGAGAASPEGSKLSLPGAPTLNPFSGITAASITVNWTAPANGATSYKVDRAPDVAGAPGGWAEVRAGETLTYWANGGLTASTIYWYRVRATNTSGDGAYSGQSFATTLAASLETITITNASGGEGATTLAPGDPEVALDAFALRTSAGSTTPTRITVTMPAGSAALIDTLTLENTALCNQGTPYGTITPVPSDAPSFTVFTGLTIGTSDVPLWVCVKPKSHAAMAPPASGTQVAVTGQITLVEATGFTQAGVDTISPARTIDNLSPPNDIANTLSGSPGSGQATVSWTAEPTVSDFLSGGEVVVLVKLASAPMDVPVEGVNYTGSGSETIGASRVGCAAVPGAKSCIVNGLLAGNDYYFVAFARDSRLNYSLGSTAAGPVSPSSYIGEGDTTDNSTKPGSSIINPIDGPVGPDFKVQARVFSPGGVAIDAVTLYYNAASVVMTRNTKYGTAPDSGVYEATFTALTPGAYTLVVEADNGPGIAVNSARSRKVSVVVNAKAGDGKLLVRDNSSQLCSDCHTLKTHSSETTSNRRGTWSLACRDCHTPHSTTNLGLVRTQITPPSYTAEQAPLNVKFWSRVEGVEGGAANTDYNGVCQVCHTQTKFYTQTQYFTPEGGSAHETGSNCLGCHDHRQGLKGTCTTCHGTAGRVTALPNADTNFAAAPPALASPAPVGQVVAGNGHLLHLNAANFRTNPIQCSDCHTTYSHKDGLADVQWGALARSNGYGPTPLNGPVGPGFATSPNCANWCHGQGLAGGGGPATFSWTSTASLGCSSCHGAPPPVDATDPNDHPNSIYCANCHGAGYNPPLTGDARSTHLDGNVQKPLNGCTACHGVLAGPAPATRVGSGSMTAAPGYSAAAVDTHGVPSRSSPTVGAHIKHVNDGLMPANCVSCHTLPGDYDTIHADGGSAEVLFDALAGKGVTEGYVGGNCTVYCHSTGVPLGSATAAPTVISWTSTTNLLCINCHLKDTIATNAHDVHVGTRGLTDCSLCHFDTTQDGVNVPAGELHHVNGTNDVQFDAGVALVAGGSYASPTCSGIYCHSNGNPAGVGISYSPVAWNAATFTGCGQCHGNATTLVTNAHEKHVNQASVLGTNYVCADCHNTVVASGNSPISNQSLHVDMAKEIGIANRGAIASTEAYASNSCDTTYCHSSGQRNYTYRSVNWTTGALTCNGCHGTGTTTGAPDYGVTGQPDTATSNSHPAHVKSGADCATCHNGFVDAAGTAIRGSSHTNGTINMAWNATIAGAVTFVAGTYNPVGPTYASATCANVKCHGNNATPLEWGGPAMKCSDCHTHPTTDANSFAFGTAGLVSVSQWNASGHGQTTFGANTLPTISAGTPCLYCHDGSTSAPHGNGGNPFRLRGATGPGGAVTAGNYNAATPDSVNLVCLNCHAKSGANGVYLDVSNTLRTSTIKVDAHHDGGKHKADNGGERCWDCHDPHGDGNIKMVGSDVLVWGDAHGFTGTRAAQPVSFTTTAIGGYSDEVGPTYNGVCQVCHSATDHLSAATGMAFWLSNGTGVHNSGQACLDCHQHQQPPNNAFQGAGACSACHFASATPSAEGDVEEFPPVYGSTPTPHKSLVDLEDWTLTGHGNMTTYSESGNAGGKFPAPTQTVEPCYYCHAPDQPLVAGGPVSTHADIASTNPFRLNLKDLDVSGTAGDTLAEKNYVCTVCHATGSPGFDPDGGASATYLPINRVSSQPINAAHHGGLHGAANDGGQLCWDCHDPHGDKNYGTSRPIAYMIQSKPTKDSADAWGSPTAVAGVVVEFSKATSGNATVLEGTDYFGSGNPAPGVCQVCHSNTKYWRADGSLATHNQTSAPRCVTCHDHDQPTDLAFTELAACNACHNAPPTLGKHGAHDETTFIETSYTNKVRHATTTEYGYACNSCHNETHWNMSNPYNAAVVFGGFDAIATGGAYAKGAAQTADTFATGSGTLTYNWTNGTCSAVYCHSNAAPVKGTPLNATVTWAETAWVKTGTTANQCTKCHAMSATATVPDTNLSHSHQVHTATTASSGYYYSCSHCHYGVADGKSDYPTSNVTNPATIWNKALHVAGTHSVAFNAVFNPGTTGYAQGPSYTCSNTYCHSNGTNAASPPGNTSIPWNSSTAADCSSCHGGNATAAVKIQTNDHGAHVYNAAYLGTNIPCGRCHAGTVNQTNDRAITTIASHVNRQAEVSMVNVDATAAGTYGGAATKTCTNVYCHSDGTEIPGNFDTSLDWDAGLARANDCKQCHGTAGGAFTSIAGEPNYTERVTTSDDVRNSHSKHVKSTADCVTCHEATVNVTGTLIAGTSHLNKIGDVTAGAGKKIQSYNPTGETCTSIACHAFKSASWGGTLQCYDCHGDSARAVPTTFGYDAEFRAAPPVNAAGGATGLAVGAHLKHVYSGTYRSNALSCEDCHPAAGSSHNGTGDAAWSALASTNPLSNYTISPAASSSAYNAAWEASPSCVNWCHGDGLSGGGRGLAWTWNATGTTCSSCHGQTTPARATPALATAHHPQNTNCAACHGAGYLTTGLSATAKASHINASVDTIRTGCTLCHGDLTATGKLLADPLAMPGYNGNSADTLGYTMPLNAGVGAHDKHLLGTTLRTGSAGGTAASCTDCHLLPPSNTDVTHATGSGTGGARATITASAFVKTDGASGAYTGSTTASTGGTGNTAGTCSVYCHGGGTKLQGAAYKGTLTTPSWTSGASAQACGACHLAPPTSAAHNSVYPNATKNCKDCHPGMDYTTGGGIGALGLNKTKHINGLLDGGAGGTNCLGCHANAGGAGARRGVTADFGLQSHHVGNGGTMGGSLTNYDCVVCHGEGQVISAYGGDCTTGTLPMTCTTTAHANGVLDLRDADSTSATFAYDKAAVAASAGAAANWTSNDQAWRVETSGCAAPASANNCAPVAGKGLDRFCLSCHDANGATATRNRNSTEACPASYCSTGPVFGNTCATAKDCGRCTTGAVGASCAATTDCNYCSASKAYCPTVGAACTGGNVCVGGPSPGNTCTTVSNCYGLCQSDGTTPCLVGGRTDCFANGEVCVKTGVTCSAPGTCTAGPVGSCTAGACDTSGGNPMNPFCDTKVTNNYDQATRSASLAAPGRVVDIASRVVAGGSSLDTSGEERGTNAINDPPQGVYARHAIRGQSLSVYSGTNGNWDTTTYWDRSGYAWASTSVMGCADCHTTDGANGTSGNAHGSGSEYLLKDNAGTAAEGNDMTSATGNYGCFRCHARPSYAAGVGHTSNGGDYQDYTASTGSARVPLSASGGNIYGMACGTCHGGGVDTTKDGGNDYEFGTIHGTSQVMDVGQQNVWQGGSTRRAYRFANGNSMRYWRPDQTTANGTTSWNWGGAGGTCYTLDTAGDSFGGCNKHGGGVNWTRPVVRPIAY